MSQQGRKYDADVGEGAIRLVVESGRPIAQVAQEMGIKETTLASWVSRSRRRGAAAPFGLEDELARMKAENAQLKREIKQVAEERDVLKRCMVLWVE